jgi:Zn-dependent protease with chaperone function
MFEGRYFAPMSARALPARMRIENGIATIEFEGNEPSITGKVVTIAAQLGSVPRRVELESGAVFEAAADADLDNHSGRDTGFLSRVFKLENSWRSVVILTAATIVLVAGIFRYGVPLAATGAAYITPPAAVSLIDAGTLQTIDATLMAETKLPKARQDELTAQFQSLAKGADTGGIPLTLIFRASPRIGANAFALPGGTIIMTDELVAAAKSDDEIAGVLAHEIAHVEERHSLQMIYRAAGLAVMVGVVAGDSGQLVDQVVAQASALQQLSYSREFEDKADRRSVGLMIKANRNPVVFVELIDRIIAEATGANEAAADDNREEKTGWFSTHPGAADRRTAVQAYAMELGWKP